ncbi:MAG: methylenetetrahydrofolate reductase (NADPH) [Kiritimatiellia bacterium]|jgi:methylenetetrahydrofolate reductase (NADPH)
MADPNISNLFAEKSTPVLSYEFFPPKADKAFESLRSTIAALRESAPDFVTVTYGAGGSTRARTLEVAALLRDAGFGPVMPHLTCVASTRDELAETAEEIYAAGYRNIMTLRGDPPQGETTFTPSADGLKNARELVAFLLDLHADFCCGVAGYPETHPEAVSVEDEIAYLKSKVDAGATFITTQLFFDNDHYFRFVDRCRAAGIVVPILPGLLPAVSLRQIQRFTTMCGASLPSGLIAQLEQAGGEGNPAEDAGIRWSVEQIVGLLDAGAPGIHLYILNRSRAALSQDLANVFKNYIG